MENFDLFIEAAEAALANYLGTDDLDSGALEMVADCMYQAVSVLPDWNYYQALLEKSSTYVMSDMTELELNDYVGELELQMEERGLV